MRISDWSSDVCSSDLLYRGERPDRFRLLRGSSMARHCIREPRYVPPVQRIGEQPDLFGGPTLSHVAERQGPPKGWQRQLQKRSEEHTSELQSLMRNSYTDFCLKQKTT